MTEQNRPLTALEAAMLGLHWIGYRWIYGTTPSRHIQASMDRKTWDTMWTLRGAMFFGMSSMAEIEILPWLTAHGITPPEVEG